ncbi:GTPase [Streptomyces sp. NBC_01443]|uniref:GTPase n=1 Tax=Streptomyces sp. NBC_01443 TaxID=2903868 RepID=UPI00224CD28C|nr:GTPase [Streptomyces sp. NBC_01443]MCX4629822.1 50S ribosome-binding GTPase [Streptomyces sp. NBC_01443]WSW45793.1 50S ribosome-binding GTPase [Streptomyces sp. NBC_01001]
MTALTDRTDDRWDDGFIARSRRAGGIDVDLDLDADDDGDEGDDALVRAVSGAGSDGGKAPSPPPSPEGQALRTRLEALRQLVGLSRTRLDGKTLAEAGRVLDEAAARRGLSLQHTVVAIAGATGSGKSTLFNSLAGVQISETGLRRPTTAAPIACSWSDGAAGLLDRLEIPGRLRRRPRETSETGALRGMVLVDLPDLDSAVGAHRDHVDRVLALVDAVVWVVDPEKYADAVLHERYLRPLAGHAEVTFVVLNQVDRLPGESADLVLDDLRRLLDDDGIALGEHDEPGATVLGLSALTGEGVGELRDLLAQFTQEKGAATRRISADVDRAAMRLRPLYVADGHPGPEIGEAARAEFEDRLAEAVGAYAAGLAAERAWRRNAGKACGTPWLRLWRWYEGRRAPRTLAGLAALAAIGGRGPATAQTPVEEEVTARQRVEQAVRAVADAAADGLPDAWAQAVRETAVRGAEQLPESLDEIAVTLGSAVTVPSARPPRPAWWPAAVLAQAAMTLLQIYGGLWLVGQIVGVLEPRLMPPVLLMVAGIVGGPLVEWTCSIAARGPARRCGQDAERRLRQAAAGCGRARVLEPVAAELLRYREVREQYATVASGGTKLSTTRQ